MINVKWTDREARVVLAAIDEGTPPVLDADVAGAIRAAQPPDEGANWTIPLEFSAGQRLKAWCDARRERGTETDPNETWTRIVARVNEAVQPFAPAKESSASAGKPPA